MKKYDQYSIADRIAEVRAKNICSERELAFLIPWFVLSWGARPEDASVSRSLRRLDAPSELQTDSDCLATRSSSNSSSGPDTAKTRSASSPRSSGATGSPTASRTSRATSLRRPGGQSASAGRSRRSSRA